MEKLLERAKASRDLIDSNITPTWVQWNYLMLYYDRGTQWE